ncbi:hypothetical protein Tco_0173597 [Tanacetum coccineum]
MWGNNSAVAPTPGAAIVAIDLGDNFTVKGHHLSMIKDSQFEGRAQADPYMHIAEFVEICGIFDIAQPMRMQSNSNSSHHPLLVMPKLDEATQAILDVGGIFLYKTPNEAHQLLEDRALLKLDWSKYMKTKPIVKPSPSRKVATIPNS